MEQVIAALDKVEGSSDWRRFGSRKHEHKGGDKNTLRTRGLLFIGEEEEVDTFRKVAIENGARGATFNPLEMRSYSTFTHEQAMESHSRQLCDIITSSDIEEKVRSSRALTGLFGKGKSCILKSFDVEMPSAIRRN